MKGQPTLSRFNRVHFLSLCAATYRSSSILLYLFSSRTAGHSQSFVTISNRPQVAHLIAPPSRDSVPPLKRVEGRGRKEKKRGPTKEARGGEKGDDGRGDKVERGTDDVIKASVFFCGWTAARDSG